jgi:hypothetical protein
MASQLGYFNPEQGAPSGELQAITEDNLKNIYAVI